MQTSHTSRCVAEACRVLESLKLLVKAYAKSDEGKKDSCASQLSILATRDVDVLLHEFERVNTDLAGSSIELHMWKVR
jgi:hypothetical protein